MAKRGGSAHVATIKTKGKDGAQYTSYLLRRSYREGGKVRHENLGNLSHLPVEIVEVIRAMLAGRRLVDLDEDFEIERSLPHGHVAAVLGVLRGLDLERLLGRERCRERDLVVAMICQRLLGPGSKLSATRRFSQTTLADELSLGEVKEAELLSAMDWLSERQDRIERTLARRHLTPAGGEGDGFVLYDLSSSYVEGRCCPLAALGYSRDGVKGKLQVNYGLICSPEGRPVAVRVHEGNVTDQQTVPDAVAAVSERFGIENVVFVVEDDSDVEGGRLFGLYEGVPLTSRGFSYAGVMPDRITIYRYPILSVCRTMADVVEQVRITVVHEIAHHFGIDDDELHDLGYG